MGALNSDKPRGIAVRANGNLVVLDLCNHRSQTLPTSDALLHVSGWPRFI